MYADQGITGTSAAKRTEFQRLMSDCRKGKIDRILTKSISRFARNTKDSLEAVRELKTLGISVYFEKENIDTGEISSEMTLAIYSQFAQEESMSISRNVRMGFQKRMADGSYVPSAVPFGYISENGKFVIDKEKAEIVRGDYLNGVSAERLAEKYRVKLATVKYVLTNEKYTGDSIFHKWYTTDTLLFDCRENRGERDKYYVSETHPAIISREIFQSVQQLIEIKGASHMGKFTVSYTLRKKIYCGECGTLYKRKSRSNRVYWACRKHDESADKCSAKDDVAKALRESITEVLDPNLNGSIQAAQQRINELAHNIDELIKLATVPETAENAMSDIAKFSEEMKALREFIKIEKAKQTEVKHSSNELSNVLQRLEKEDFTLTEYDDIAVRQLIEKITVESKDAITVRFKGGFEIRKDLNGN